jgi:hypothetical protein
VGEMVCCFPFYIIYMNLIICSGCFFLLFDVILNIPGRRHTHSHTDTDTDTRINKELECESR